MKRDNINYLLVGSTVLIGFTLMLYFLYRLTGGVGENDLYFTNYQNVGGLNEGTPVTYQGYKVGSVVQIEPIRLQGKTNYRITILIRDGWKIPEDSIARIYSEGLLAATVINIEEGQSSTYLALGAEIYGRESIDVFKALNSVANETSGLISGSVRPLLDNINTRISSMGDQLDTKLPAILNDVIKLVETLQQGADRVPRILNEAVEKKVIRMVDNSEEMSANLLKLSEELISTRKAVGSLLGQTSGMVKSADSLLSRSHGAIESVDSLLAESQAAVMENRADLRKSVLALKSSLEQVSDYTDSILHNLEGAARNMNEFSREIRDNPGLLLGGKPAREVGANYE